MATTVRVNFELDKDEYAELKQLVQQGNSDISKCMRSLVREFLRRDEKDTFAKSIVVEVGADKLDVPALPVEE